MKRSALSIAPLQVVVSLLLAAPKSATLAHAVPLANRKGVAADGSFDQR